MGSAEAAAGVKLGPYELVTLIGAGGMAEVHLAVQRGPAGVDRLAVVKLIHEHLATQKPFVDMLLDEGRLAGSIRHPNVVDIYDLGEADGRYFVAMEYLDGESLLSILHAGADGERLDPLSTARVIANTAEGLEAAHRLKSRDGKPLGLVHHDVSLGNIVVLYTGNVKLVDFGVAKARTADRHDRIQGKSGYMAPEKLVEGGEVDRKSDIWSLGVVAWEALTLRRLFKGDDDADTIRQVLELEIPPPSAVNPDVPPELDPIVMRALERDPVKRFWTAKGFGLELEEVLRKCGYGGPNGRIARYMQATFGEQIAARERLVRGLRAGKSADQLAVEIAAFRAAQTRTPAATGDGLPIARPRELAFDDQPAPSGPEPRPAGAPRDSIASLQSWLDQSRKRTPPFPWRLVAPIAGTLAILAVILIARGCHRGAAPTSDAPLVRVPPAPPAPPVAAKAAPALVERSVLAVEPPPPDASEREIEMDPGPTEDAAPVRPDPRPRPEPRATASAEQLYTKGLELYRHGDARAALESLAQARRADPSYAPAWYGLGLVYESIGNKSSAKTAYQRYVQLAPNAANADQIRYRITRL